MKAGFQAWPTGGKPPLTVRFFDFSEGEIVSRVWDFGDGSLSTDKDPYHTYSAVGNGTVSLTVYDGTRSDTETKPGYIIVYPPSGSPNTTEVTGDIPPPWWQE